MNNASILWSSIHVTSSTISQLQHEQNRMNLKILKKVYSDDITIYPSSFVDINTIVVSCEDDRLIMEGNTDIKTDNPLSFKIQINYKDLGRKASVDQGRHCLPDPCYYNRETERLHWNDPDDKSSINTSHFIKMDQARGLLVQNIASLYSNLAEKDAITMNFLKASVNL